MSGKRRSIASAVMGWAVTVVVVVVDIVTELRQYNYGMLQEKRRESLCGESEAKESGL
jgi:hypothetical protein